MTTQVEVKVTSGNGIHKARVETQDFHDGEWRTVHEKIINVSELTTQYLTTNRRILITEV